MRATSLFPGAGKLDNRLLSSLRPKTTNAASVPSWTLSSAEPENGHLRFWTGCLEKHQVPIDVLPGDPGGCGRIQSATRHPISRHTTSSYRNHLRDVGREQGSSCLPFSVQLIGWPRFSGGFPCGDGWCASTAMAFQVSRQLKHH